MKYIILCVISFTLIKFIFLTNYTNNVCKTFEDYYTDRDNNENCYHNPDQHLTVPEIIRRHGYPLEIYNVTTKDGYILTLFRIPNGKQHQKDIRRKPIFLQHGFGTNSVSYLSLGKKSLGFILADEGYDVWLGNFRGSKYSLNHTELNQSDKRYWNFSQHEHGVYDLDVQVECIWNNTHQKIVYIGFSMGTISIYIYASSHPEVLLDKVELIINLAPSAFMTPENSYLRFGLPLWPYLKKLIFFESISMSEVVKKFCSPHMFQMKVCLLFLQMAFGFNTEQHDPETLPAVLAQVTDTFAVKSFDHIVQMVLSGNFQQYDHGPSINRRIYGLEYPPKYELSNVNVPSYIICAKNDLMVTIQGAEKLFQALPMDVTPYEIYVVNDEDFSHLDFVMGKDAARLVYVRIVDLLRKKSKPVSNKL